MAILLDEQTRVTIQGITGRVGRAYAERMRQCGTRLVSGVTPGRSGSEVAGVPVFGSVQEAVAATAANTSLITVPAPGVAEAGIEAIDAGIKLMVIYTEHVPVMESMRLVEYAQLHGVIVIGPNAAGVATPGKVANVNVSDIDDRWLIPGRIGIVSRSGTLTYEVLEGLRRAAEGISTLVCVGGDLIIGLRTAQVFAMFMADPQTEGVAVLGEVGGLAELEVLQVPNPNHKPVVAYIAGQVAPPGKRLGHAGAIAGIADEAASSKSRALAAGGITTVPVITDVAPSLLALLATAGMMSGTG